MIGPVLVQQDQSDAQSNVDTRLEFIRGEMCAHKCLRISHTYTDTNNRKRVEGQLKDIESKSETKKNEVSNRCISSVENYLLMISVSLYNTTFQLVKIQAEGQQQQQQAQVPAAPASTPASIAV